ncbi:dephospho-CoA kinase [Limnofasciculus baicalensis]|uniref:Dephospho-CoA kinase n=1 Tax=Limnofasciculus baicalensis BBK-W-15 TaxID=2699891 RepID=A0AAE3KM71_9CYAN|nr:dephospho-CoA kinase [Limnofasciculus baicalensis]MCP2729225.1 dephospho-CoA kinase [Limnofasciculus baicalensis BBK-W-15]
MKRIIGLTGGIATGKTTVSNYLATAYQLPILDADIYAREAVQPGTRVLRDIFARYGDRVKLADGTLNRQGLGEIIFNDTAEREWVEAQIHPYVRQRFEVEIARKVGDIIVLAIPLLFEANMTDLVTEIWVIFCNLDEQLKRIRERDSISVAAAQARINSQFYLEDKVARADMVLDNSSTLDNLWRQVDLALGSI